MLLKRVFVVFWPGRQKPATESSAMLYYSRR